MEEINNSQGNTNKCSNSKYKPLPPITGYESRGTITESDNLINNSPLFSKNEEENGLKQNNTSGKKEK